MLQLFRDDSLPPDVLCFLVTDGSDTAILLNALYLDDAARMREAVNALLAEHGVAAESLQVAM